MTARAHDIDALNKPIPGQCNQSVTDFGPRLSHQQEYRAVVTVGEVFARIVIGLNHLPLNAIRSVHDLALGWPATPGLPEVPAGEAKFLKMASGCQRSRVTMKASSAHGLSIPRLQQLQDSRLGTG